MAGMGFPGVGRVIRGRALGLCAAAKKWDLAQVLRGVLAGAAVIAGVVYPHLKNSRAEELGYVLADVSAMGVSFLAAQWGVVLAVNLLFGGGWLWLSMYSKGRWLFWRLLMAFISRQVGHLEALFLWLAIVLSLRENAYVAGPAGVLSLRLVLVVLLLGYGAKGVDLLAHRLKRGAKLDSRDEDVDDERFHEVRRWLLTSLTLLAFVSLYAKAPKQAGQLFNLFFAIAFGMVFRLREAVVTKNSGGDAETYRKRMATWAREGDRVIRAVFLVGAPVLLGISQYPSIRDHESDAASRMYWLVTPSDMPVVDEKHTVSLFIVSDSQFHELDGERVGAHLDLVNGVVPVSVRPIEQDLLSGVTLAHFGKIYAELVKQRPGMLWAHLGDYADLGCTSEMDRAGVILEAFGDHSGGLAALVPGNHDSTFIGNFTWHPDWQKGEVCKSDVLWKDTSDRALQDIAGRIAAGGSDREAIAVKQWSSGWDHRAGLAWVTTLGVLDEKSVVGVFLDSSDYTGFGLGVDGIQGSISDAQARAVTTKLDSGSTDAWVLFFMHHPYDELSWMSRRQVDGIAKHIGVERLLGIVSAHTHFAARRALKIDGVDIAELVVGSTIDPPQEAALLEVSNQGGVKPLVRIRTIPAVRRAGQACLPESHADITGETCAKIFLELDSEQNPSCELLFEEPRLDLAIPHFTSPAKLKEAQQKRARSLLSCLLRDPAGRRIPANPLADSDVYKLIADLAKESKREEELVCLSWAASVLQGRKQSGWRLNHALAMSLEQSATFGAVEMISTPLAEGRPAEWTCRDAPPPAGASCLGCP